MITLTWVIWCFGKYIVISYFSWRFSCRKLEPAGDQLRQEERIEAGQNSLASPKPK